jgi:tetratricopeptide (TPR) repeat protein
MQKIVEIKKDHKKLIIFLVALIVLLLAGFTFNYVKNLGQKGQSDLSPELEAEYKQQLEMMEQTRTSNTFDVSRIHEVDQLILKSEFEEAKSKIETILQEDIDDQTKQTVYSQLAMACTSLVDLNCLKTVAEKQEELQAVDIFLLVDSGELALNADNAELAEFFYSKALSEIESNGGESYVNTVNETAEKQLDYGLIKSRAGE